MAASPSSQPSPDSGGIHLGDVGGSVNFSALGDIVGGDKITTITTTIQISVEAVTQRPLVTASPYRGLDRFEDRDKDLFFGRDQLIKSLLAQLSASNVLLVLGASGSGKSSVVRAGLLPQLSQLIGARFRYFTFVPDVNPFESLRAALQGAGFSQTQTRELAEAKAETPARLIRSLQRNGDQWLLFVDQFEEIFTVGDEKLRGGFIEALVQIAQDSSSSTKLVLAMRADFLDRFSPFPQFAKIIEKNIDFVADMHADELRQAIEQPAARHGVVFEQGLVEEIIKDVQGQAGSLPLLQYTLDLLWQEEAREDGIADRHLNTRAYRELGGVRGALQKRADEIYASFGDVADAKAATPKQAIVRQIFLRLVDLAGEGSNDAAWRPVRRRASMTIFTTAQEQEILQALINQKLLVSNREGDDATVEVAHEALFTSWGRLKNWIEAGKQVIFARNRLGDDARRWQRRKDGRDSGADEELLSGSRLSQAIDMRARGDFQTVVGDLSEVEGRFLDSSAALREKRAKLRRKLEIAGVALLLLAVVGAIFGWIGQRRASTEAKNASQTFSRSDFIRAADFLDQGGTTEALAYLARAVETSPDNHAAADRIFNLLTQRQFCIPVTELTLPGEIGDVRFASDGSCLIALINDKTVQVWDAQKQQTSFPPLAHDNPVNHVRFSDDGKLLGVACGASESEGGAAAKASGYAQIWNMQTGKAVSGHLTHTGSVSYVSFNQDGSRMVSASQDHTVCIWDIASGKQVGPPLKHEAPVQMAEVSGDGRRIVSVSGEVGRSSKFSVDGRSRIGVGGNLTVWNAETGTPICSPTIVEHCVLSARFSPDGKQVAAIYTALESETHYESIRIFDSETGQPLGNPASKNFEFALGVFGGGVSAMDSSVGSDDLLVSYAPSSRNKDYSGSVLRWSWKTGEAAEKSNDFKGAVDSVRFSPDGKRYVTTCADGMVRFWKASGEAEQGIEPLKPEELPRLAQFSPDGKRLLVISGDRWAGRAGEPANHAVAIYRIDGRPAAGEVATYTKPAARPGNEAVSPDGTRLIKDNALYDAKTGKPLVSPLPLKNDLGENVNEWFAKFSPDGKCFVTGINYGAIRGDQSGAARLWDGFTGRPLTEPLRHEEWVIWANFSGNSGKFLTIAARRQSGVNGTPRIWDVATGRPLSDNFRRADADHGSGISASAAEFVEEGLRFRLTAEETEQGEDTEEAKIWDAALPQNGDIPVWLPRLAQLIGGYQLNNQSGIIEPVRDRSRGLSQLRDELAKGSTDNPYVKFGRWVLSDPSARTISPYSKSSPSPKP